MKLKHRPVVLLILSALLLTAGSRVEAKDDSKHFTNHRGGQAAKHMNRNGSTNNNPQWSADPTRGWVRAEERQELPKHGAASKSDSDKGKPNAKGKAQGY